MIKKVIAKNTNGILNILGEGDVLSKNHIVLGYDIFEVQMKEVGSHIEYKYETVQTPVMVEVLDENGAVIVDTDGSPVMVQATKEVPVLDENGEVALDSDGSEIVTLEPLFNSEEISTEVVVPDYELYKLYNVDGTEAVAELAYKAVEASRSELSSAVQNHLDATAKELRYDNMMSARRYAGYANEFQDECLTLAQWASSVWVEVGNIEAQVLAGEISMPTAEELINLLPKP